MLIAILVVSLLSLVVQVAASWRAHKGREAAAAAAADAALNLLGVRALVIAHAEEDRAAAAAAVAAAAERRAHSDALEALAAVERKDRAVDEAISLAERMGPLGGVKGADKLAIALDWARGRCLELHVVASDAELRKLIELRKPE